MSDDLSTALARVKAWTAEVNAAKEHDAAAQAKTDKQSLERAADLEKLYHAMRWPDELPKPKRAKVGRPLNLRSRERFAKWVQQETGWGSQQAIARLHDALTFYTTNKLGVETTEGTLRPLFRLRKEGYGDHMLAVWQEAVKASNGHPTSKSVKAAVKAFIDARKPTPRNAGPDPRAKTERRNAKKNKIVDQFRELLDEGDQVLAKDTVNTIIRLFNERDNALRAAGL